MYLSHHPWPFTSTISPPLGALLNHCPSISDSDGNNLLKMSVSFYGQEKIKSKKMNYQNDGRGRGKQKQTEGSKYKNEIVTEEADHGRMLRRNVDVCAPRSDCQWSVVWMLALTRVGRHVSLAVQ